jgi:hypothetical protein
MDEASAASSPYIHIGNHIVHASKNTRKYYKKARPSATGGYPKGYHGQKSKVFLYSAIHNDKAGLNPFVPLSQYASNPLAAFENLRLQMGNGSGVGSFPRGIPHDLIPYFSDLVELHGTVRHPRTGLINPYHQPKMRVIRDL